jgi:hypothetical protein
LLGITVDWNDEHDKALGSIRLSREPDSNGIDGSDSLDSKHNDPGIWTVLGIALDWNDEIGNTKWVICVNHEFDSNQVSESRRK